MIHAVVFHSSQNQTNRILFLGIFRLGAGMDRRTASALGDTLFMAPTNTSILNFMGPDALRSATGHIDLPNKRALIFRGKHPPSCGTTTIRARKSPLKKRNRPAAAGLRMW
jgi:hypothetical protein